MDAIGPVARRVLDVCRLVCFPRFASPLAHRRRGDSYRRAVELVHAIQKAAKVGEVKEGHPVEPNGRVPMGLQLPRDDNPCVKLDAFLERG